MVGNGVERRTGLSDHKEPHQKWKFVWVFLWKDFLIKGDLLEEINMLLSLQLSLECKYQCFLEWVIACAFGS